MTRRPVSVAIVTFNGMRYLEPLRNALEPQLGSRDEVLIFDNASTDGTPDWIEREWASAKLTRSRENLYFVGGNNRLTTRAAHEVVLYLNQDTVPDGGVVARAAETVGPRTAVTFAQQFPWADGPLIPYLDWSGVLLWRRPSSERERTSVLSGGAFALDANTIADVGGLFDPRMKHYCEDINLSLRLQEAKVDMVALSDVVVEHDSKATRGSVVTDFRRATQIARERLLAFAYALGVAGTLKRLPGLVVAGVRKAGVDGRWSPARALGLTAANILGYLWAVVPRA